VVPGNAQLNNLAKMKTKTEKLYSRVLYIQKKLKMQLPVYIVVTKCDKITGFEELIRKIPDEFNKNILGWSSPYNTNVISYTKNWINEAFESMGSRMTYLALGLCIDDSGELEFGRIMNLRYEFEGMKYPLQILTNKLFTICNNALLAPIIFRGIYFAGSKTTRAEEIESGEKAFIPDLIDKKITREASLAKPVRKIIIY
jgi:type VI secretion system protein ImpL